MSARVYSEATRAKALELYRELGPRETARRMGIPVRSITRWAHAAGATTEVVTKTAHAVEAAKVTLARRKQLLADQLLDDALRLREQLWRRAKVHDFTKDGAFVTGELDEPTFGDKQRLLTSIGIAVDKVQLLTGGATSRAEVLEMSKLDQEIEQHLERMRELDTEQDAGRDRASV